MAEPIPAPALTSTADATPYVSVSWVAVGAASVAGLFVFLLLFFGYAAFREKKPVLIPELLVLPVIAMVLSFAARKLITNSEGTRTGTLFNVDLVKASWWVALVGGLGYSAYLFAIDYSVRRDAAGEGERWVGMVLNDEVNRAFIRTLDPGRRGSLKAESTAQLQAEFRIEYLTFTQCDLVQLAKRNPGACTFTPTGVREWNYQPGITRCAIGGTIKSPEGTFPMEMELRGIEGGVKAESAGRHWAISLSQNGFLNQDKSTRTPYGWRVLELERSADGFGKAFLERSGFGAFPRAVMYQTEINPDGNPKLLELGGYLSVTRIWVGVDPSLLLPFTADYPKYIESQFIRTDSGGEHQPERRELFRRTWLENGLLVPGRRIKGNEKIDTHNFLTVTDNSVEVRVPCEVPLFGSGGAARGRLVLACTEPDVVAELKRLRGEANPAQGTASPPDGFGKRPYRWRPLRVETDLMEVKVPGPGGPGGTDAPPGNFRG